MDRWCLATVMVFALGGVAQAQPAPASAEPQTGAEPAATTPPASTAPAADEPGLDELLQEKAKDVADRWAGPGEKAAVEYPWIEHHGYLRVRGEGFFRAHLGTDHLRPDGYTVHTSGFYPPLTDNGANSTSLNQSKVGQRDEDWIAGANMRFRYSPTIHVAENLRITAQFDVLDNLLLGSTPDYNPTRPDAPLVLFSHTQAPLSGGRTSLKDAIAVKQAYMTWDILGATDQTGALLSLSAGRMARHWGLGIVENGGTDLDSDFGTYVDRVTLLARPFSFPTDGTVSGLYFELGYGWVASGPTSVGAAQPYGEPHDLTSLDNVSEVTFALFQKPMTDGEKQNRFQRKVVQNKPVLDWGAYLIWRRQELDISATSATAYQNGTIDTSTGTGYDQLQLVPRNAWTLTPDIWLKLEWVPGAGKKLRFELEAAGVFGHIGQVQPDDPNSSMDIRSYGFAFESACDLKLSTGVISFGVDAGLASGDNSDYFGWLDRTNFADPKVHNPMLASFYFNPDYRTDQLLFRNVVGTVTDAFYVKPWVAYDLFESEKDSLGARLDIEYARALEAAPTPGNDPNLGVETDLKIFYEDKGLFFASIEWAMLWPMAAFDLIPSFEDAGVSRASRWSTALRGRVGIMF